jgi:superfamily II DNA/RNA helicase
MTFDEFGFNERVTDALFYMGFQKPTPIQELAIPKIISGVDVLATAQTGTGKTAAFVLPILHQLASHPSHHIDTLVIVPTRELALQIDQQIQGFSYYVEASSIAIYGGGDGNEFHEQRTAIKNGVNIIVATPGKLISHLNMGYVDLTHLKHFVLDEADRMLDMGFFDDIKTISRFLPEKRQNMLFSATMPPQIHKLTKQILDHPYEIKIAISKPVEGVKQLKYEVYDNQKIPLIIEIIKERQDYTSILIFTSTKKMISEVVNALQRKSLKSEGISSDLTQKDREEVLLNFRSRKTRIVVATDVLSRGIDIKDINLVINYDVPGDAEDYVHRIGRTARAETKGEAITLVNQNDAYKMLRIERLIEKPVEQGLMPDFLGDIPSFNSKKPSHSTRPQGQSHGVKRKAQGGFNKNKAASDPAKAEQSTADIQQKSESKKPFFKNRNKKKPENRA